MSEALVKGGKKKKSDTEQTKYDDEMNFSNLFPTTPHVLPSFLR